MATKAAKAPTLSHVSAILSHTDLKSVRAGYRAGEKFLEAALRDTLPVKYQLSAAYVNSILNTFFTQKLPPDEDTAPRSQLSARDRERCIIALLSARGGGFNLALHIYLGLMLGISPEEIANILLLAGAYTGVDNFSDSIDVEERTLKILKQNVSGDPKVVFPALRTAFPE